MAGLLQDLLADSRTLKVPSALIAKSVFGSISDVVTAV
jgi:hypothetical protein